MPLVIRNYRNSDFERFARIFTLSLGREERSEDVDRILGITMSRPGYDPMENLFMLEKDSYLVGFADLVYEMPIRRAVCQMFSGSSENLKRGGEDLIKCLFRRCREFDAAVLQFNIPESDQETSLFLKMQGFSSIRCYHNLEIDLAAFSVLERKVSKEGSHRFKTGQEAVLAELQNRIFEGSWGFCPNSVEDISFYLALLDCRIEEVLCIEDKGRKLGYVWNHTLPQSNGRRERYRIHMMGVDPDFRGRGLGRTLLINALLDLSEEGARKVELTVDSRNGPALGLYHSLGFGLISRSFWFEKRLG